MRTRTLTASMPVADPDLLVHACAVGGGRGQQQDTEPGLGAGTAAFAAAAPGAPRGPHAPPLRQLVQQGLLRRQAAGRV